MNKESKSIVAAHGKLEGSELSFSLPFNSYFEVLATGTFVRKHRATIWLLGANSYTRFEQEEEGVFGRDVFLTSLEGNEGFPGFPVNVRIESRTDSSRNDWSASKMRITSDTDSIESHIVVESFDSSESSSEAWDDCRVIFNIVK